MAAAAGQLRVRVPCPSQPAPTSFFAVSASRGPAHQPYGGHGLRRTSVILSGRIGVAAAGGSSIMSASITPPPPALPASLTPAPPCPAEPRLRGVQVRLKNKLCLYHPVNVHRPVMPGDEVVAAVPGTPLYPVTSASAARRPARH